MQLLDFLSLRIDVEVVKSRLPESLRFSRGLEWQGHLREANGSLPFTQPARHTQL